jgi:hypothetical protein
VVAVTRWLKVHFLIVSFVPTKKKPRGNTSSASPVNYSSFSSSVELGVVSRSRSSHLPIKLWHRIRIGVSGSKKGPAWWYHRLAFENTTILVWFFAWQQLGRCRAHVRPILFYCLHLSSVVSVFTIVQTDPFWFLMACILLKENPS